MPNGVPLYPVLSTRPSRVITAPTRRPRQSARVRAASAMSRKYVFLSGRGGASGMVVWWGIPVTGRVAQPVRAGGS